MAVTDRSGFPIAACIASASPAEVILVDETLDSGFLDVEPELLIVDKASDSDPLDEHLLQTRGITMIAPNRRNRIVPTQDGRLLRRDRRRWKVERLFAWLQNFRRLNTRWEWHAEPLQNPVPMGSPPSTGTNVTSPRRRFSIAW